MMIQYLLIAELQVSGQVCMQLGYAPPALCLCIQKQGRFEVYEGDSQPPMSPPVSQGSQFMDQNLGSKPATPEHST